MPESIRDFAAGGLVRAKPRGYLWAMDAMGRTFPHTVLGGLVVALALVWGGETAQPQAPIEVFARDRIIIESAAGGRHRFDVELALTPGEQAQGLMFRRKLPANAAMLFIYRREAPVAMWMKNTLIPLDILFVAGDGRIVKVVERAVPQSLETIWSGDPVLAVLEINGGTAARLAIRPGDRILYSSFADGS